MTDLPRREIFVLTGPTAVGKTALALEWAERNGAEVVSCDSLLFYRGMDIGTAKPTVQEQARVPHHLIDVVEVAEPMDVTTYVRRTQRAVEEIQARGRRVLVTGGSGFYLRAFFAPVADNVVVPVEIRREVASLLESAGLEALVDELGRLNPAGLGNLDTANPRRVVRALERCRASGRTLAELNEAFSRQPAPFAGHEVRLAVLSREPAELTLRIESRVRTMLAANLLEEVRGLVPRGLRDNPSAAKAIGYRESLEVLDGTLSLEELGPAIVRNTHALVKKQRTWFRTQLPAHQAVSAEISAADLFTR